MADDELPTILLVPGGFALPSCYNSLLPHLHQAGYPTVVADIPSCNAADPSTVSCSNDVASVRERFLVPLCDGGHSVVLFVHSYGGIIAAAALGFSKSLRVARGDVGGVIGLVYLVGNIVLENESLLQTVGGTWPPYIKTDTPKPGFSLMDPVMDTLYGDVTDPELAKKLEAAMTPHATAAFTTPAPKGAWTEGRPGGEYEGRLAYLRTTQDATFPPPLQDQFLEKSGVDWTVVDIDAAHGAFASKPEEVAGLLDRFARKWMTK